MQHSSFSSDETNLQSLYILYLCAWLYIRVNAFSWHPINLIEMSSISSSWAMWLDSLTHCKQMCMQMVLMIESRGSSCGLIQRRTSTPIPYYGTFTKSCELATFIFTHFHIKFSSLLQHGIWNIGLFFIQNQRTKILTLGFEEF